jgi:hypothetical protein
MKNKDRLEINFTEQGVGYSYISLGHYAHGTDGISAYWPNSKNKKDFLSFLINADLCIVLFTLGQQANWGKVDFISKNKIRFILSIAQKWYEEYDSGICLKEPLFLNWETSCNETPIGKKVQAKLEHQGIFDNIFVIKNSFEELQIDLNNYKELFK